MELCVSNKRKIIERAISKFLEFVLFGFDWDHMKSTENVLFEIEKEGVKIQNVCVIFTLRRQFKGTRCLLMK